MSIISYLKAHNALIAALSAAVTEVVNISPLHTNLKNTLTNAIAEAGAAIEAVEEIFGAHENTDGKTEQPAAGAVNASLTTPLISGAQYDAIHLPPNS